MSEAHGIDRGRVSSPAWGGRPRRAGLFGALLLLAASIALQPIAARGDEPVPTEFDRWQLESQLAIGLHNQTVKVRGSSTLGASGKGSRAILTSLFSLGGGLLSPAVLPGLGRPRLYLRAGYKFPVAQEQRLIDEDKVVSPAQFLTNPAACGTNVAQGTRSCEHNIRMDLQIQDIWNAGFGVQFTVPIAGQEVKLETGVEYLGERLQYSAATRRIDRGVSPGGGAGQILATNVLPSAVESDYVHSIGPRAALGVNVAQWGRFQVLFHVETSFYFYPVAFDTAVTGSSAAGSQAFRVQSKQPFVTQAAGGLTVSWR